MTINETSQSPLPSPRLETRKRRLSLVWLMPLLALAIAGWVVWNNYASQGPIVTITFDSASGIRAGTTQVRIRDLRIGVVEEVGFSDGMGAVEAKVRFDKNIAKYVDADAQFWLVQPKVTARGVTGIDTLLSGVYIAASWDGQSGPFVQRFTALETPPLTTLGEKGTRITLRMRAGGQLAAGAPVLASGIEVGRLGQPVLSKSGTRVTMEAFIFAPYNKRLTTNTRFWDSSGVSVKLGAEGLAVKVDSLAALLEGGVSFGTPVTGGEPAKDGNSYEVFASEAVARADAFEDRSNANIVASMLLDTDVNGLGVGTLVKFRGVKVGEVEDVIGISPEEGSGEAVKLRIDLRLSPTRLGLPRDTKLERVTEILQGRVKNGLRARVGGEGLFGQTVIIELANLPSATPASLSVGTDGRLMLPTAPYAAPKGEDGINGLVTRVSDLPIEELMASATQALAGVAGLTETARGVLAAEGMQNIPTSINRSLVTVEETLADVRTLVASVRDGGAIDNLNATLKSAQDVLAADGMQNIPASVNRTLVTVERTLADISALVTTVRDGGAIENLNATLKGASEVLGSEGINEVPATVNRTLVTVGKTLEDIRTLVTTLRDGGAVDNLNATLKSAQDVLAADGMKNIPTSVNRTLVTVERTLADISALVTTVRDGGAIENLNATLKGASEMLGSEGMDEVPATVNRTLLTVEKTLEDIRTLVTALRDGGAVDNLNATLRSADSALKSIEGATSSLPALAKRLNAAADSLQTMVSGYNANSRVYKDARGVLRDVSSMADSFRSLAKSIERNPSSLLRGR